MRTFAICLGLGVWLTACNSPQADQVRADCTVIAEDPEGQESISRMGTDTAGFCTCALAVMVDKPDADKALIEATLNQVAAQVLETGESVEEVAASLIREAMSDPDNAELQDQQKGVALVGRLIDEIESGFKDSGTCPAS